MTSAVSPRGPQRLLAVGARLSIVAALLAGLVGAAKELSRVAEQEQQNTAIWAGWQCAAKHDDETLKRTQNDFGNYNITKLGCGPGSYGAPFYTNAAEVAEARRGDRSGLLSFPFSWGVMGWYSLSALALVNLCAGLVALTWVVGRWVLGWKT